MHYSCLFVDGGCSMDLLHGNVSTGSIVEGTWHWLRFLFEANDGNRS